MCLLCGISTHILLGQLCAEVGKCLRQLLYSGKHRRSFLVPGMRFQHFRGMPHLFYRQHGGFTFDTVSKLADLLLIGGGNRAGEGGNICANCLCKQFQRSEGKILVAATLFEQFFLIICRWLMLPCCCWFAC
jgi:hypothetical protein